jgi:hypothetical protein
VATCFDLGPHQVKAIQNVKGKLSPDDNLLGHNVQKNVVQRLLCFYNNIV